MAHTRTPDSTTRARIAAYARSAKYPPAVLTAAPRAGFVAKFEREADPEGILSAPERQRRAKALMTAHMLRLARRSAEARRKT